MRLSIEMLFFFKINNNCYYYVFISAFFLTCNH